MKNSPRVSAAIEKVFYDFGKMTTEELVDMIENAEPGPVSVLWELADSLAAEVNDKRILSPKREILQERRWRIMEKWMDINERLQPWEVE